MERDHRLYFRLQRMYAIYRDRTSVDPAGAPRPEGVDVADAPPAEPPPAEQRTTAIAAAWSPHVGELAETLSKDSGRDILVLPGPQKKLFVSRGEYGVDDLTSAMRDALRLAASDMGEATLLEARGLGVMATEFCRFSPPEPALLSSIGRMLASVGRGVDLRAEGVPFSTADCFAGKRIAVTDLSEAERRWMEEELSSRGRPALPSRGPGGGVPSVQLGSSYSLVVAGYKEPGDDGRLASLKDFACIQVFWDFPMCLAQQRARGEEGK